jgi:hypothetical protein
MGFERLGPDSESSTPSSLTTQHWSKLAGVLNPARLGPICDRLHWLSGAGVKERKRREV